MPRERGLDYTPEAEDYSFDDTATGEAAQASFQRLASGYPQQEPDDIHHFADVITGTRDSTLADLELRKVSGLYSMTPGDHRRAVLPPPAGPDDLQPLGVALRRGRRRRWCSGG